MQGKILTPYQDQNVNIAYNRLFCDNPELFKEEFESTTPGLFESKPKKSAIKAVVEDINADVRLRLLACELLRNSKGAIQDNEPLGVIVEVGLYEGLDTLAVYRDGTIKYISAAEEVKSWQVNGTSGENGLKYILTLAKKAIEKLPPINHKRMYPPFKDMARFTILSTGGMYVGQGSIDYLQKDSLGEPFLSVASEILIGVAKSS